MTGAVELRPRPLADYPEIIIRPAGNGGWVVVGGEQRMMIAPTLAALSDDQALVDWIAIQLALSPSKLQARPPNPGPAASAEAIQPPPVDGAVHDALQPFAEWARAHRYDSDDWLLFVEPCPGEERWAKGRVGDLRTLMRAAGLWTDDMQAPAPTAPASEPEAGVAPPPPAEGVKPVEDFEANESLPF